MERLLQEESESRKSPKSPEDEVPRDEILTDEFIKIEITAYRTLCKLPTVVNDEPVPILKHSI